MNLVATGTQVGLTTLGMEFDPAFPHTCCLICGDVFQSDADRDPFKDGTALRKAWSHVHAREHPSTAHRQLAMSGRWCTPEAAHVLAAFGVINLKDLVMDEEVSHALATASAVPSEDSQ